MVGSRANNFDFSAQDPSQDPNKRNSVRAFFCLGGKHSPQLTADIGTMASASSAVAPAAVSLHKHPSANILVRGHHSISDSAASLSLPSPLDLEPPSSLPMPPRTESISRQRSYLRAAMEKFDKKMSSIFFFELNVIGMVCWMNSYQ